MSRRGSGSPDGFKRDVGVDFRYNSELVQKFINVIMRGGKKGVARSVVYNALDLLSKKYGGTAKGLEAFVKGFEEVIPKVEVRSRRVGGSVYQVPVEVRPERARALAMRWIIGSAKTRPAKTMGERLYIELMEASEARGAAVKKKFDVHRMAEANRAFSHYAW